MKTSIHLHGDGQLLSFSSKKKPVQLEKLDRIKNRQLAQSVLN